MLFAIFFLMKIILQLLIFLSYRNTSSDFSRINQNRGFPGGSAGKESACHAGDLGLIPGLGSSPGGGHGNLLRYSCLENPSPLDRGASQATVHGVTVSQTPLSD